MKLTFLAKLILAFVAVMLATAILPNNQFTAHAQSKMSAPVNGQNLRVANFPGGRFERVAPGSWVEYDKNGVHRYTFREIRRDAETVYLREDTIGVDIELNATRRIIMASWPGMARHQLYRMGSVRGESHTGAPSIAPPPAAPRPIPTPPPIVSPPIQTTSANLASMFYPGGRFEAAGIGSSTWTEYKNAGGVSTYTKLGYDEDTVYLFDRARNALVQLDVNRQMIRQSRNGGSVTNLYPVTRMEAQRAASPTPERPDYTLSNNERMQCLSEGGFVEKAGIMGAERCTKRYSDGGQVCTDSAQCQGKCVAELAGANQDSTSGICQRTDNPFGCYAFVENGRTGPALCAD